MPCWVQRAQGLSGSPHEPQGCAAPLGAENHPELDEGPASVLRWFPDTFHDFRVASVSHFRVYQPHQTRRGTLLWLFYFPLILSVWGPGPPWWGSGSTRVQAPEAEMQSTYGLRQGPASGSCPCTALQRRSGPRVEPQAPRPDLAWPSLRRAVWLLQLDDSVGWGPCTHGTRRLASVVGRRAGTALLARFGGPWAQLAPHHPTTHSSLLPLSTG